MAHTEKKQKVVSVGGNKILDNKLGKNHSYQLIPILIFQRQGCSSSVDMKLTKTARLSLIKLLRSSRQCLKTMIDVNMSLKDITRNIFELVKK